MPVPVRVSFNGSGSDDVVKKVVVHVRRLGTSEYTRLDASRDEQGYLAEIPPLLVGEEPESYAMEYFLVAFGEDEKPVATVGTRGLPLTFLVATRAELAEELDDDGIPLFIPIAIGAGVATAVVVAGVSAIVAFIVLQPKTGSATVTVRQETP
jgi:hypothetical protein